MRKVTHNALFKHRLQSIGGNDATASHHTDKRQEILVVAGEAVEARLIKAVVGFAKHRVVVVIA